MDLRRLAGLLLSIAFLVEASIPAAARLGAPAPAGAPSCRCLVQMACCRTGQCGMEEGNGSRPSGPAFAPCRGARPDPLAQAPPDLLALLPAPAAEGAPARAAARPLVRPLPLADLELPVDPFPPRLPA